MSGGSRRRWLPLALVLAFVVVPLIEIYVLVQVGQVIGAGWTILLLIGISLLGGWLFRREGGRAFRALRSTLNEGRMPARELADGALILIGATLLLTPGFFTDALGALLILPVTRPVARRALQGVLARRLVVVPGAAPGGFGVPGGFGAAGFGAPGQERRSPGPGSGGSVVQGEVVDDDPPDHHS